MRTLLLILIAATSLNAQTTAKEAKALLAEVSENIKSSPGIQLAFTYTFENPRADASMKQSERGDIVLSGESYRLNFMGVDRLHDGKTIYTFLHDDKEVQIMDAEDDDDGFTPGFILNMYKEGFSYSLAGTSTANGKKVQHIMLKSLKSPEIEHIEIQVFAATKQMHKMIQKGRNGSITTFDVTDYKELSEKPNLTFNRKKYAAKGYYIVE